MKILANIFLITLILPSIATAADSRIAIIVNAANTQNISQQDISNIYRDRIITWDNGEKIDIYNLPTISPSREKFSQKFLGISAMASAAAESNRHITNSSRNPQLLKRERLVILSVTSNINAIGYVKETHIKQKKDVRILFSID